MPVNHFINRSEDSMYPDRLNIGDTVYIIQKEDQGTRDISKLVLGNIVHIYSKGNYYKNGAKVQIILSEEDPRYAELGNARFIGRVQYVMAKVDMEDNPYLKYL
jgi:uncharacterized protein YwbE